LGRFIFSFFLEEEIRRFFFFPSVETPVLFLSNFGVPMTAFSSPPDLVTFSFIAVDLGQCGFLVGGYP